MYFEQDKGVLGVITMEEDVARHRTLAVKVKVTVMDPGMEDKMMETEGVEGIWYAAAITAKSLVFTTMRKMIAVRNPHMEGQGLMFSSIGVSGVLGQLVIEAVG